MNTIKQITTTTMEMLERIETSRDMAEFFITGAAMLTETADKPNHTALIDLYLALVVAYFFSTIKDGHETHEPWIIAARMRSELEPLFAEIEQEAESDA